MKFLFIYVRYYKIIVYIFILNFNSCFEVNIVIYIFFGKGSKEIEIKWFD